MIAQGSRLLMSSYIYFSQFVGTLLLLVPVVLITQYITMVCYCRYLNELDVLIVENTIDMMF